MDLRPLRDQVIVKRCPLEEKTESGLLQIEFGRESMFAEVIAVNPESCLRPGDRVVLAGRTSGKGITIEGERYLAIKDDEAEAILE